MFPVDPIITRSAVQVVVCIVAEQFIVKFITPTIDCYRSIKNEILDIFTK